MERCSSSQASTATSITINGIGTPLMLGIKAGAIHGTVVQPSQQIIVPTVVVTSANIDDFMLRLDTMRGK